MRSGIGKVGGMPPVFQRAGRYHCSTMGFMGLFPNNRLVDTDGQDGKASSY